MSGVKLEELKQLLFQDRLTDYGKRQLVEILEKQQKEIEELKKDKKALVNNYDNVLEHFISKDKIREKIKELENKMEKYKKENKENSYFMANYDKSILQELLGEE